ncbi:hypothetical protein [Schaalia dentiphila]|uniref:hypothetical protein n=1 Tax=Schaalia dentiphila TaxID=3050224 RepID=UPI0026EA6C8C|nr:MULTISPECIES: hypothetical protein [Schaalia]
MAGEYQSVSVDSAKQEAAAVNVVESFDAMTASAEGASALGAAQKSMFWGHETGPRSVQDSSTEMFNAVSELLKNEAALISTFEAEINAALSSFTGTEHENKAQMEKINQALDRVAKSDAAVALKASIGEFSKAFGVSTGSSAAGALVGSLSGKLLMNGGLPHASGGGSSSGSASASTATSAPSEY